MNDDKKPEVISAENIVSIRQRRSNKTLKEKADKWLENVKANRKYFMMGNCEVPGIISFIVGAGPSLEKNVEQLKRIKRSSKGMVICVDAALPYLIKRDIIPQFCISIDGDGRMWDMVNDVSGLDTSNITLFATLATCPELISNWKGPIYFFMLRSGSAEHDAKIYNLSRTYESKRDIKTGELISIEDINLLYAGITPDLIPGGNVTAAAYMVALVKLGSWKMVFTGLDLSWKKDENFYAGKANENMGHERVDAERKIIHRDMNNEEVYTNASLLSFKQIHEEYARSMPDRIINATEGGIFGVEADSSLMKEIEFLTLEKAIDKYIYLEGIN